MILCRHCQRRKKVCPRGLCFACYHTPSIRRMYPPTSKFVTRGEPTMAELDALIARQMKCLPSWWQRDVERMAALG